MDKYEQLDKLTGISPIINEYITSESFRLSQVNDSLTTQSILNSCYEILADELQEIGIHFYYPLEEVLENYENGIALMTLYERLKEDHIKGLFLQKPEFKTRLVRFLETDQIDRDNKSLLHLFIEYYKLHFKYDADSKLLKDITYFLTSTSGFEKYIRFILSQVDVPTDTISHIPTENLVKYIQQITRGVYDFNEIVTYLIKCNTYLNVAYLQTAMDNYDLEKVQGEKLYEFYFAIYESKNVDLTEYQQQQVKHILEEHESSQTHHIEYYIKNKVVPTTENLVELIGHFYDTSSPNILQNFEKEYNETVTQMENYTHLNDPQFFNLLNIYKRQCITYINSKHSSE